ncbi:glycogen debranching protein GlgX [Treponema endosymbiont of Eucomonympha sp.]|uniref:glycogen debranching protein GlgX n=1 Tax=Treponema endosymbiont of Eucomonympha sp. TaxID=1580831 RepID=UPI0027D29BF6|nr:glycogen debranching protein GlgX [Treponema endosymbiont of Eucomonympha sp.]
MVQKQPMEEFPVSPGKPQPLGATYSGEGVNFSIFSRNGTAVTLALYRNAGDGAPFQRVRFDPAVNRTGDVWHAFVRGLPAGTLYLYHIDGPFAPEQGHWFDRRAHLIDPYAKELTAASIFASLPPNYRAPSDLADLMRAKPLPAETFPKCAVIDDAFDWQGDRPLNYPLKDCVIYEAHVKGFTASPTSGVKHPGTYLGLCEKIPYLQSLGITSVELLPVHEFDERENRNVSPRTGKRLTNYWGYSTVAYCAPKAGYACGGAPGSAVREFKEMVREFHRNSLEIILDVVFNHTAEGNERGVTFSFRGIDNAVYYLLDERAKRQYKDFSGCGNTVNCNHPVVSAFIIDCLRYWVLEMHVDGFRFDLAPILGRGRNGDFLPNPPLLESIAEDAVLSKTKIIAEPWDAGGAYLVGNFPGGRWAEWNDRFRDDIRRFWAGADFIATAYATRLSGSADIYRPSGRKPFHSINFVACHDGFTLNDLVSYNGKHNEDNGEQNRDGGNCNLSYNYGFEGATENPSIEAARNRQIKNFLLTLLLAQGTPMLLAGDEFRRTQRGNNNAFCQDNEFSWLDWTLKERYAEIFRFCARAIQFRKIHPAFRRPDFFEGRDHSGNQIPDILWFARTGKLPDWCTLNKFLAFYIKGNRLEISAEQDDSNFYIMCNADNKDITVTLPPAEKSWYRCIDTSVAVPLDFLDAGDEELLASQKIYVLPASSTAILIEK